MNCLVPAPIRDLFALQIVQDAEKQIPKDKQVNIVEGLSLLAFFKGVQVSKSITLARIVVASLAVFALYKGTALVTTLALTAIVSPAAFWIAAGACLVHSGLNGIISAVASGALMTLAMGLLKLIIGWGCIQGYKVKPIGIIEQAMLNQAARDIVGV